MKSQGPATIDLDLIERLPWRVGEPLPELKDFELAIAQETGVIDPVMVRPRSGNNPQVYEIVRGEKQWLIAQRVGIYEVPVYIRTDLTETEARRLSDEVADNPLAGARIVQRWQYEEAITVTEAARRLGLSRSDLSHRLRVLSMDPAVREAVESGRIGLGQARPLVSLPVAQQRELAGWIVVTKPSARAVESRCREIRDAGAKSAKEALEVSGSVDPDHKRLEQKLSELVGAPVRLDSQGDGTGELRIHFHSLEILDGILARLGYDADAW